jgi:hypothetical protein
VRDVLKRHRADPEQLQRAVCRRHRVAIMEDFEAEHRTSEEQRAMGMLRSGNRR